MIDTKSTIYSTVLDKEAQYNCFGGELLYASNLWKFIEIQLHTLATIKGLNDQIDINLGPDCEYDIKNMLFEGLKPLEIFRKLKIKSGIDF